MAPPDYHPETSAIVFAPSNPLVVYAASANHNTMIHADLYEDGQGVLRSEDGGFTWATITGAQFADAIVTDLAVDPTDEEVVFAASRSDCSNRRMAGKTGSRLPAF